MDFGGITGALVRLSLDASLMNHYAISNNIANANSVGYQPVSVNFEHELQVHKESLLDRNMDSSNALFLKSIKPVAEKVDINIPAKVALDLEMVKLNKNMIRYQALLEGQNKMTSIIKMAIQEGR